MVVDFTRRCTATIGSRSHFQARGARYSTPTRPCTEAATSATAARSGHWTRAQFPRSALSFRPLQQSSSSRSANLRLSAACTHPLGATWDGRGTNFALFSANARRSTLPLRQQRPPRNRAHRLARANRGCLARLSERRARPDSSTAIAFTAATSPSAASASTPTSSSSTPMPGN